MWFISSKKGLEKAFRFEDDDNYEREISLTVFPRNLDKRHPFIEEGLTLSVLFKFDCVHFRALSLFFPVCPPPHYYHRCCHHNHRHRIVNYDLCYCQS